MAQSQLSPERLREVLQRAVHRSTGRELGITGAVRLHLGLAPSLVVDGISLSNLPGASRPALLMARSLSASLALLPLLGGEAVIERLAIDQPDILLETLPDGAPNWQFVVARRPLYQPAGTGGGGDGKGRVEIHEIVMQDGRLAWRRTSGQTITIGVTRLALSSQGPSTPMTMSLKGERDGAAFSLAATSGSLERLQGGLTSKLAGAWPITADFGAGGGTLHVEGGLAHPDQLRGYQLKIRGDFPDLSVLNAVVPEAHLPPLMGLTLTASVADGTQSEVRTSQVSAQAGPSDLSSLVPGLQVAKLELKAPGPGQIAQLSVEGTYSGAPLRLNGTAVQPDMLSAAAPVQVTLDASAADAVASVHGTVPSSQGAAGLDLLIALRAPDLARLSPFAGRPLPDVHGLTLSTHATDAGFKLRGTTLSDLAIASSVGDLAGTLTIGWSPRLAVRGTVKSASFDADALWSALPGPSTPPAAASPPAGPAPDGNAPNGGFSGSRLPLTALRETDLDVSLAVSSLVFGGQPYRDLDTRVQLADGKLAINPFRVSTPGGSLVGGATADASTDAPPVAVTLRSAAFSAAAAANLMGYPGGASGSMQLDVQLSGTGESVQALAATASGHFGLAMVGGDVDNALVQAAAGAALDAAGAPSLGDGRSQVRCLALRLNLAAGRGRFAALALDTSRLAMDGTGSLDLGTRSLDLHLRPQLRLGSTAAQIPVSLSGSFDDPKARLDPVLGGRVGITIGSVLGDDRGSACIGKLAVARGGLQGPMPPQAAVVPPDQAASARKLPTDLLRGLFH